MASDKYLSVLQKQLSENNADMTQWVQGWTNLMVQIWEMRIRGNKSEFGVKWNEIYDRRTPPARHTWQHLLENVGGSHGILSLNDPNQIAKGLTVRYSFALYGLYVDMGVGREFGLQSSEGGVGYDRYTKGTAHSMGGKFMPAQGGMSYSTDANGHKHWRTPRQPRRWFSQAWSRSCIRLLQRLELNLDQQFVKTIDTMASVLNEETEARMKAAAAARRSYLSRQAKKSK